jgi:hypothetical protein
MTQHEAYRDELERILDHCALDTLLEMLAEVCWEKSDHSLENWQDAKSALLWIRAGHYLEQASQTVPVSHDKSLAGKDLKAA